MTRAQLRREMSADEFADWVTYDQIRSDEMKREQEKARLTPRRRRG